MSYDAAGETPSSRPDPAGLLRPRRRRVRVVRHPVRPSPDCEVTVAAFAGADGRPLSENGEEVTWEELDERAYQDLVDSGRCEPPSARWRHWLG